MNPELYALRIRPSAEGGFEAIAPKLPGCRSDGDTPEEALRNGYDAIACWIEAAREMGRPVPDPKKLAA